MLQCELIETSLSLCKMNGKTCKWHSHWVLKKRRNKEKMIFFCFKHASFRPTPSKFWGVAAALSSCGTWRSVRSSCFLFICVSWVWIARVSLRHHFLVHRQKHGVCASEDFSDPVSTQNDMRVLSSLQRTLRTKHSASRLNIQLTKKVKRVIKAGRKKWNRSCQFSISLFSSLAAAQCSDCKNEEAAVKKKDKFRLEVWNTASVSGKRYVSFKTFAIFTMCV